MKTPKECEKNHQNITTSRIIYKKNKKKNPITKPEEEEGLCHQQTRKEKIKRTCTSG
jgi:hypothetical protein